MTASTIRSRRSRRSAESPGRRPVPVQRAASPEDVAAKRLRARAAEAYCAELQLPAAASAAAARHAGDDDLLRSVRVLAAKHAAVDPARRGWRRVLAAERECGFTPFLLAGRSNDELSDAETQRLDRHLESCLTCQAAELRFGRAERAFDGVLRREVALEAIGAAAVAEQPTTQFERVTVAAAGSAPSTIPAPQPAGPPRPLGGLSLRTEAALATTAVMAVAAVVRRRRRG